MATEAEIEHATNAVIGEALNQGRKGWEAVANVIANRVDDTRYPGTVAGVLNEKTGKKGYFSFSTFNSRAREGTQHMVDSVKASTRADIRSAVEDVFSGRVKDNTKGATSYATPGAAGSWHTNQGQVATVGGHSFYGETKGRTGAGMRGTRSAEMQAPIDSVQTASFRDPNAVGVPTPADRAAQFGAPVQASAVSTGLLGTPQAAPETSAAGLLSSGLLSPEVTLGPTSTDIAGLLSPSSRMTAPAQVGGVAPNSVTSTNPAGIDGVARSTGRIGTPTQAQRGGALSQSQAAQMSDTIDNIDVPGSLMGPLGQEFGRREGSLAPAQAAQAAPSREMAGFFSGMGSPQAAAPAQAQNPEAYGPAGSWRGADASNTSQAAIGPGQPSRSSYSSTPAGPSTPAGLSGVPGVSRSWGPTAGPSQEVDTFAGIGNRPTGLASAYGQMAASMAPGVTNLSGMSVAPADDPYAPDITATPVGMPTNIQPGIRGLGTPTAAQPQKTSRKGTVGAIAKGAVKGAMIGGLPGAVLGGLLASTGRKPGQELSGFLGRGATALGGFFGREPDTAGIAAGRYGSGGNLGAGTYGVNGTSRGMGGFEQFGAGFAGPGSGGWADAGQGFGQGSAADWM